LKNCINCVYEPYWEQSFGIEFDPDGTKYDAPDDTFYESEGCRAPIPLGCDKPNKLVKVQGGEVFFITDWNKEWIEDCPCWTSEI